ncbi:MAG: hypothetical protein KY460_07325, partial [Actinobacteria bacterium]|nr:hypothetical protein [Actinomycetota bacterium]
TAACWAWRSSPSSRRSRPAAACRSAQFAGLPGAQPLRAFDRLRRRRNTVEYGETEVDSDEAAEAGAAASRARLLATCSGAIMRVMAVHKMPLALDPFDVVADAVAA